MGWIRTVDGELINLEHTEAFTIVKDAGTWAVIAELNKTVVSVACDFTTAAEASRYIHYEVFPRLASAMSVGNPKE